MKSLSNAIIYPIHLFLNISSLQPAAAEAAGEVQEEKAVANEESDVGEEYSSQHAAVGEQARAEATVPHAPVSYSHK